MSPALDLMSYGFFEPVVDIAASMNTHGPMSMNQDLDDVLATVLSTDPSFSAIGIEETARHIDEARRFAHLNSKDEFLLSLMCLLALSGNGHTRLIPNVAISVFPLRFVTIGTAVRLLDAAPAFAGSIGDELISINDVPIGEIEAAAGKFLAGTRQRKHVIGPILFVWPSALRRLGVLGDFCRIKYRLRSGSGQMNDIIPDTASVVPASVFYPQNEHGRANASWSPESFLEIEDFGQYGLLLRLPSFFDPDETSLPEAISKAADLVRSRADTPLLIDVRGNTGGDFLRTMPLIDALSEDAEARWVGVIVDKFTFSAAIVFVAILKHRLGSRLTLLGEEMGDGLTFFAEGGTLDLPSTGAVVRYSSALHDWAGGCIDATTPSEIASEIVPVGKLELDGIWVAESDDFEALHRFCRRILASLRT